MAAYKFPQTLKIKTAIWNVVITNTLVNNEWELYGLCDPSTRTIFIKKHLTQRQALSTFWHEVLHAFEYEYDLKLGHPLINKLEFAIADLLRFNTDLVFTDFTSKKDS